MTGRGSIKNYPWSCDVINCRPLNIFKTLKKNSALQLFGFVFILENFVQNNNNPCFFLLTLQLIKNKIYLIRNKLQHPYFLILIIVEFCNCLLSLIFSNIIVTLHRLTILQYYGKIVAKCWSLISFNYTRNSIHFNKII